MNSESLLEPVVAFTIYLGLMVAMAVYFYNKTKSQSDFVLGGRKLGSFVTALSANASDFSGWLLLGLPGAIYASGFGEAWIAVGLACGFLGSWVLLAPRLRVYTHRVTDFLTGGESNSLTLSSFLENRFADHSRLLRAVSAIIIIVFYFFYVASGMTAMMALFDQVFGLSPVLAVTIGLGIIVAYTVVGGFLAVSVTDTVQAMMMWVALLLVPIIAISAIGGLGEVRDGVAAGSDSLLSAFGGASLDPDTGTWEPTGALGWVVIVSGLAWAFGYFGQPHILARYMGIRSVKQIPMAATVSVTWAVTAMTMAVLVGYVGIAYFETPLEDPEQVFPALINALMNPWVAGFLMAAILAAVMSTADSQLLVASSAITEDGYRAFVDKHASPTQLMWLSRITVVVVAVVAALVALFGDQSVMDLVGYAWAGFGAGFGPVLLMSVFWRRMTWTGALAGMVAGASMAVAWDIFDENVLGLGLYAMIPAVALSFLCIVVFNPLGKVSEQMASDFDAMKHEIRTGEPPVREEPPADA